MTQLEVKKIAVVRLDKIGDLILTTPAIASLSLTFPGSSITAIVNHYNRVVLEHCPYIREIWEWEWNPANFFRLRKAGFDLMVVFSPTTPSYWIAFLSRAKIRAGYVYASRPLPCLFSKIWLNQVTIDPVDQKNVTEISTAVPHEVEQNLELVKQVSRGKYVPHTDLVVPIPDAAGKWAREQLKTKPCIGFHLAGGWRNNLPPDFVREILKELSSLGETFLTYGPEECAWADSLKLPEKIRRFGRLSFDQWGALIQQSSVFLTTNTGSLHLAASQKVPVLAVFEPEFYAYHSKRWHPWKVPYLLLRKDNPDLFEKIVEGTKKILQSDVLQKNFRPNLHL